MTDPQIPYTPPAEPAAPVAEPVTPIEPDYSVHPVWGKAIEAVPEILRTPIYEAIRTSENEARKAIEGARGTDIPQDWRELAAEAQQMGVSVDELAAAYQGQQSLAELLQADPDAFVTELQSQVDAMVQAGQLSRRDAANVMHQANAAAADAGEATDDLLTDEQRTIRELQQWKAQQEAAQQRAAQEQQQQAQAARIQQEEEAASNAYFDTFDREMESSGFMVRDESGRLVSAIPVDTLQLIARTGAGLIDANPQLQRDQAIKQATEQVRRMIESAGGKLGPAARQIPPVMGASSSIPNGVTQQPAGAPRTMADRMAAALAEATRQAGAGQ